jgi:hypothetical protein
MHHRLTLAMGRYSQSSINIPIVRERIALATTKYQLQSVQDSATLFPRAIPSINFRPLAHHISRLNLAPMAANTL